MIDEVLAGRHTPPTEMDVAHDAIAVAYSLIQRHSDAFVGETADAKGAETAANVVAALCASLQTSALSREAAISAAVTVAAAAGIGATAREHAAALADAFFPDASGGSWIESCGAVTPPSTPSSSVRTSGRRSPPRRPNLPPSGDSPPCAAYSPPRRPRRYPRVSPHLPARTNRIQTAGGGVCWWTARFRSSATRWRRRRIRIISFTRRRL